MTAPSWEAFADALECENRTLGELGAAALALTQVLVCGAASEIERADRLLEARRILHLHAHQRRMTMMRSGFGDVSLRQVCGYAPPQMRRTVFASLRELRTRGISLQLTVSNNKALISAGLKRIANTITVMQRCMSERTGTYRRLGTLAPPTGSLIVSKKA